MDTEMIDQDNLDDEKSFLNILLEETSDSDGEEHINPYIHHSSESDDWAESASSESTSSESGEDWSEDRSSGDEQSLASEKSENEDETSFTSEETKENDDGSNLTQLLLLINDLNSMSLLLKAILLKSLISPNRQGSLFLPSQPSGLLYSNHTVALLYRPVIIQRTQQSEKSEAMPQRKPNF